MDEMQTFVGAAQQVIDMMQQVVSKVKETQTRQVALKVQETQTQQVISKSQADKYFWDGVKAGSSLIIASAYLLYMMTHPTCKVTHEATLEALEEALEETLKETLEEALKEAPEETHEQKTEKLHN